VFWIESFEFWHGKLFSHVGAFKHKIHDELFIYLFMVSLMNIFEILFFHLLIFFIAMEWKWAKDTG